MHVPETIIGLLLAVAAIAWLAARLKIPYPVLLVIGGLALSFVPGLPRVKLDPHLVFVLFLPPVLYYAGLHTSWRDFRANLRPISLLATGLVLFTTCIVAAAAHLLIGMDWAPAFVLGAIVSPPDAVAATAITERLRAPRRVTVILEGESLVNDATALVAYRFAVAAVVTGAFSLGEASARFVLVAIGGVIVGLFAAMLVAWVRPHIKDAAVEGTLALLTPYVAYLPAEWLGVSGVLAVVTCGIYISRRLGHITSARVRLRAYATWDAIIFLLNGLIFVLIGLQLAELRRSIPQEGWLRLVWYAAAIGAVAIIVRMLWVFPATYLPRKLLPKLRERDPAPPRSQVFLIAWTGMRGVVSLAAALALPERIASGAPFPHRDSIIVITFGVILVTLVGQGLTLPPLIRWLRLDKVRDDTADEETTARYLTALAAVERLDALGARDATAAAALTRLRAAYDERIAYYIRDLGGAGVAADAAPDPDIAAIVCTNQEQVILEALKAERTMLVRLRDDGVIADDVMRRIEQELDLEESKLDAQ